MCYEFAMDHCRHKFSTAECRVGTLNTCTRKQITKRFVICFISSASSGPVIIIIISGFPCSSTDHFVIILIQPDISKDFLCQAWISKFVLPYIVWIIFRTKYGQSVCAMPFYMCNNNIRVHVYTVCVNVYTRFAKWKMPSLHGTQQEELGVTSNSQPQTFSKKKKWLVNTSKR